jgi:hypothetical protein
MRGLAAVPQFAAHPLEYRPLCVNEALQIEDRSCAGPDNALIA